MAEPPDPLAGVPASGRERLEANKHGLFTSDLSVSEYLLLEDVGYEPLGLVVGSSIYHIGYQRRAQLRAHELDVLSKALYHARQLAMQRMEEEAADLDADGIVAVRLTVRGFSSRGHVAEFLAVGTAVCERDSRPRQERPFTSDLSGQDFWALARAGKRPVGLVMGSCVYSVPVGSQINPGLRLRSTELPNYTQALYDARELAMTRMQREAQELAADGIVGVDLVEHEHGWSGKLIEFFAIGTAILTDPTAPRPPSPTPVIDFR